jgi:hypothetical protein
MGGGAGDVHTGFWWGDLMEREYLKELGIDRRIILKWIFKKWDGGMEEIALAQVTDRWLVLVNAVMKLWFHRMRDIS